MRSVFLILFLLSFNQNFACECKTYPIIDGKIKSELFLEDSFDNATIIFYGTYVVNSTFENIKFYRGKKLAQNRNLIVEKNEATNCDYGFEKTKNIWCLASWINLGNCGRVYVTPMLKLTIRKS